MSDPTPAPTPTDEQAFEDRAMRQRTSLTNPSPLLLRVRQHVRDHGGDGKAFDWAVNDHVRAALGRVSAAAPDEREVLDFLDEMNTGGHISYGDYSHLHALINALAARPAPVVSGAMPQQLPTENYGDFGRGWNAALRTLGITVADAPAADDEGARA